MFSKVVRLGFLDSVHLGGGRAVLAIKLGVLVCQAKWSCHLSSECSDRFCLACRALNKQLVKVVSALASHCSANCFKHTFAVFCATYSTHALHLLAVRAEFNRMEIDVDLAGAHYSIKGRRGHGAGIA